MRIWRLHVGFFVCPERAMVRWVQLCSPGCAVPACLAACLLRTDRQQKGETVSLELMMRRLLLSSSAYRQRAHPVVPSPPRGP